MDLTWPHPKLWKVNIIRFYSSSQFINNNRYAVLDLCSVDAGHGNNHWANFLKCSPLLC